MALGGEHWLPVPGWPEYECSNRGMIKRRLPAHGARVGHELAQHSGGGKLGRYLRVQFSRRGQRLTVNVHMIVAITWLGDRRAEGLTVDHVNGDPEDNRAENLRWVTASVNSRLGNGKEHGAEVWDPATGIRYSPPGEL